MTRDYLRLNSQYDIIHHVICTPSLDLLEPLRVENMLVMGGWMLT